MDAWHSTLGPDLRIMALISAVEDIRHADAPAPRPRPDYGIMRRLRELARAAWTLPASRPSTPVLRDYPFARS
jgi:hypothetical protein